MPRVVEEDERAGPAHLPAGFCCPHLHEAVELVGRRWTGAILEVLRQSPRPLRFTEIAQAVPDLSDRLCSERMKELQQRRLVGRRGSDTARRPRPGAFRAPPWPPGGEGRRAVFWRRPAPGPPPRRGRPASRPAARAGGEARAGFPPLRGRRGPGVLPVKGPPHAT